METGTGKTYVYIKTMFELNKRYGWSKFIVVVPSIAIREGVKKSFEITTDHFMEHYGKKARFFVYNSSNLNQLDNFSSGAGINVMIINTQAFASSLKEDGRSKESKIIYSKRDEFRTRRPIDVIKANRPIIILDEPTVGLDPKQMIEIRQLICSLGEKHTVILSSHILSEVSAVCDEILIISQGKLVASDTPEGLAEKQKGASILKLSAKGRKEDLENVLQNLPGTEGYTVRQEKEEAVAEIREGAGQDVREGLFYALAEKKMPILSLERSGGSLEEIFLQLTESAKKEGEQ